MNRREVLSAACIAVLATIHFPAEKLFAQLPGEIAGETLQLVLNSGESSQTRLSGRRDFVEPGQTEGYIVGADSAASDISTWAKDSSGTAINLVTGNLKESQYISGTSGATCACAASEGPSINTHGIDFTVTYNCRDADGSRAQLDTVLGFGWTHSFNIFLFSQRGSMFRFGGDGRVTKYALNPDNTFTADTGYFETLVRQSLDTFLLTLKDQTRYTFTSIPGAPLLARGPVYWLTQIQDRNNDTITLTYSGGNLVSISDTYGRKMILAYNAQQKIRSVTNPLGQCTTFTFDRTGRALVAITDPSFKMITYAYNSLYQLTDKATQDGRRYSYPYINGKPAGSIDSLGVGFSVTNSTNYATDPTELANHERLSYVPSVTIKTDGLGNLWSYHTTSHGCFSEMVAPRGTGAKMTAPRGDITRYTYDAGTRRIESVTDPNNHTTKYSYDAQGNRTKITLTAPFNYATTFTYEPVFNMMTSMTDPKGRITTFFYDRHGNRVLEVEPLLQQRRWSYDAHGNVLTETDKRGHTTAYHYDAEGNRDVITAPPPLGFMTRMTYDRVGNLKTRTDPNDHITTFDYDDLNRLVTETDPAGNPTQTSYDGQGNRTATTDRNQHTTFFEYDQRQRLITTTDALGHMITAKYDGNNNRTSTTDKNGHTTTFEYDAQNRLSRTTDAEGNVSTMTYDPAGNLLSTTDANLHTTTYTYDELNRRRTVTDTLGYMTRFEYDMGGSGCGTCGATPGSSLITKQTDGNDKVTYFKYDPLDRLTTIVRKEGDTEDVIDPSDAVTRYAYDANNNRRSMTEPNGNTTAYEYDELNRRTRERNAAGDVALLAYDGANNLLTMTAPNGNMTKNTYDELDRVVQVDDRIGRVAESRYDNVGNRLRQTDGNGNTTTYFYDVIDRPTIVTDPLLHPTVTEYDAVGNILQVTDREGHITANIYDKINRRTSSTDALGHATQYQYDGVGNVLMITDANGHATQYKYDDINRVIRETYADPPPNTRTFAYDAVNLISRTDQKNQTTMYAYNDLYFLMKRTYPISAADNLTYDLSGRMVTAERGGWLVTFLYDRANRVTYTTQNGKAISHIYDIPGRTRTVTYPGGRSITERTDFRSRLSIIDDAASPPPIVQYSYDLGNRVVTRSDRNGAVATYGYNATDWVTSLEHTIGGTHIAGFRYDFDKEGNKKFEEKRHDADHSEAYQYDEIYRLTDYKVGPLRSLVPPVTQTAYNLDPVGNWNSKTTDGVTQFRRHDEANELTGIDATNLTYDDNGNLQNDGVHTYAYDEENRLTRVTRNSDSAIVGQYQYDALSRRVQKIANPAGVPSTTRYLHDGARIIEEQDTFGVTQATYTYGNYIDEALTMDRGAQTFYYHQNSLWSVEAITDAAGNVVERYAYDAYGLPAIFNGAGAAIPPNPWGTPRSAIGNPWMFTGRQDDEETGLCFYRARYYDPLKGRFLQRDSLDYVAGINLYAYVRNAPVNWRDPWGLDGSQTQLPAAPHTGVSGRFEISITKTDDSHYVEIHYTPGPDVCCDEIQFFQIVQTSQTYGRLLLTELNFINILDWHTLDRLDPGWQIDSTNHASTPTNIPWPYYPYPGDDDGKGGRIMTDSNGRPYMTDTPGGASGLMQEFETCAVCARGRDKGRFLGCRQWLASTMQGGWSGGAGLNLESLEPSETIKDFWHEATKEPNPHNRWLPWSD